MLVISIIILVIYIIASIIKNKGIPISLSATYYIWPKWIFPSIMIFIAFILLPYWLEATNESSWQFTSFLACAGLVFIGATPNYRNDKNQSRIHYTCAYIAAIMAILSVIFAMEGWKELIISLLLSFVCFLSVIKICYVFIFEFGILITVYIILL